MSSLIKTETLTTINTALKSAFNTTSKFVSLKFEAALKYTFVKTITFGLRLFDSAMSARVTNNINDPFAGACAILSVYFMAITLVYLYDKLYAFGWFRALIRNLIHYTLCICWAIILLRLTGSNVDL